MERGTLLQRRESLLGRKARESLEVNETDCPGRGGRECPVGDEHGEGDGLVPGSPEGESRRVKTSRRAGKGAGCV